MPDNDIPQRPTNQELVDFVVRKLFQQGKQARANHDCAYRGSDGTKCAVGFLIPDEEYHRELECYGPGTEPLKSVIHRAMGQTYLSAMQEDLLYALRSAHDSVDRAPFEDTLATHLRRFHRVFDRCDVNIALSIQRAKEAARA